MMSLSVNKNNIKYYRFIKEKNMYTMYNNLNLNFNIEDVFFQV